MPLAFILFLLAFPPFSKPAPAGLLSLGAHTSSTQAVERLHASPHQYVSLLVTQATLCLWLVCVVEHGILLETEPSLMSRSGSSEPNWAAHTVQVEPLYSRNHGARACGVLPDDQGCRNWWAASTLEPPFRRQSCVGSRFGFERTRGIFLVNRNSLIGKGDFR